MSPPNELPGKYLITFSDNALKSNEKEKPKIRNTTSEHMASIGCI